MLHCFDISLLFTGFSLYLFSCRRKKKIEKNLEQECYKICKEEVTILKKGPN